MGWIGSDVQAADECFALSMAHHPRPDGARKAAAPNAVSNLVSLLNLVIIFTGTCLG
jgi:hypothetical protein